MSDFHSPIDCSMSGSPALHYVPELFRFISTELVMLSNHWSCHPLLFLPSIFASIRVFSMSQIFASGGQSIRVSASASVLSTNIEGGFSLGLTGLISLKFKGLSESSPTPQFKSINSLALSFPYGPTLTSYMTTGKTIALTKQTFVDKVTSLLFNMLSRFIITFLPRSKHFFNFKATITICSDFGAQENKSLSVSMGNCFPIYLHEVRDWMPGS